MNAFATAFEAIARNADAEVLALVSELICVVEAGECDDYEDMCRYYAGQLKAAQEVKVFAADIAIEIATD